MHAFAPGLWLADGPTVSVAGFRYPTRMAMMPLAGGGLFIWSPVAITDALRAEAETLGRVTHIVAPNALHNLHIDGWRKAYPEARVWAPPGLRERRKDLAFDADLADDSPPDWANEIDQVIVRGNIITHEVVFFHRLSRTVIFTDLLQNFDKAWFKGWRGVIARLDNLTSPVPAVPQKFRAAFTNRRLAREALTKITAWPAERVLMAHGTPVSSDGKAFVREAFRFLMR